MVLIPIVEQEQNIYKKDEIIKQGLILCTRSEQWYTKRKTAVKEIKLRKTRLRWRRFYGILRPDRLELYHSTALSTKRLAHTVYFNPQPPLRPVRLSLISAIDHIWSLEFTCNKHIVSFHFQSCLLSESGDWYRQVYYRLPNNCKKPLPLYVDINIQTEPMTVIRIPLDYFKEMYKQGKVNSNMCFKDVKSVLSTILSNGSTKNWKLFWSIDTYLQPIDERDNLIGCQLIEQTHQLELRQQPFITNKVVYEGLLTQKSTYYTLLYGQQLWFLDEYYYNNTPAYHRNWFSATSGLIMRNTNLLKKRIKNINFSTPQLASSLCISPPDPSKLAFAKAVLHLDRIHSVEQSERKDTIEIRLKNTETLYYKAPDTQSQKEWISLIRKKLIQMNKIDPITDNDIIFSSTLYVKKNYSRHYTTQYCILAKNAKESVLLMFDMTKQSTCSKKTALPVYQKKRALLHLQEAYIYTGNECVLDQLVRPEKVPASYYYKGGITTEDPSVDCIFVIWQLAKRHFVSDLRESLSLLKLGHRLGQKGTCWIFKAKSKEERDSWMSVLHK